MRGLAPQFDDGAGLYSIELHHMLSREGNNYYLFFEISPEGHAIVDPLFISYPIVQNQLCNAVMIAIPIVRIAYTQVFLEGRLFHTGIALLCLHIGQDCT